MGDSTILPKVFLLVGAMAAIAVIELLIPLRLAAGSRRSRWPGNLALTAVFLAMNLALTAGLLGALLWMEQHRVGLFHWIGLPGPLAVILGIVILDLAAYAVHVCMHKTPALWRVHRARAGIELAFLPEYRGPHRCMLHDLMTGDLAAIREDVQRLAPQPAPQLAS